MHTSACLAEQLTSSLHCPSWRYQRELHDGSRMYGPSVGDETGSQWDKLYAFPHIKCGADEQFL